MYDKVVCLNGLVPVQEIMFILKNIHIIVPACVLSLNQHSAAIIDVFDGFIVNSTLLALVVNIVMKDGLLVVPSTDHLVLDDHDESFPFRK